MLKLLMRYLYIDGDDRRIAWVSRSINVAWRFMKMTLAREVYERFVEHVEKHEQKPRSPHSQDESTVSTAEVTYFLVSFCAFT